MSEAETKPSASYVAITENDSTILSPPPRALFIGTGGDLVVRAPGSNTSVTFKNVPDGAIVDIKIEKLMAASTVADVVALY